MFSNVGLFLGENNSPFFLGKKQRICNRKILSPKYFGQNGEIHHKIEIKIIDQGTRSQAS
jgi:hypothetical protein